MRLLEKRREARLARVACHNAGTATEPGCAVGVSIREGKPAVWQLRVVEQAPAREHAEFVDSARESEALARRLVLRELGAIRPELLGQPLRLVAEEIEDESGGSLQRLTGRSFGLAQGLAVASYVLQQPLRREVAALATIEADGRLGPVGGLDVKLRGLRSWASCVTTLLIAHDQELEDAQGFNVVRLKRLDEALSEALEIDVEAAVVEQLDEAERADFARTLFRLTVRGSPHVISWALVERLATRLGEQLADLELHWQARVAQFIASRHAGRGRPLPLDRLHSLPAALQLELVAHGVQAACDACSVGTDELIVSAKRLVEDHPGHAGTLKVLGALGRFHAAWHEHELAIAHLSRATECWFDLLSANEANRAVCEWLRILGAAGRSAELDELLDGPVRRIQQHPDTTDISRSFLALAAGRALLDVGQEERARDWLVRDYWTTRAVQQCRLRQLSRLGAQATPPTDGTQLALTRLDQGDLGALDALRANHPAELSRLLDLVPPTAVARWWRY
ncbi:MAG: hypothetical protein GY913_07090 [Proteobacteria bacterium]|nr:hypothetical protein [Pseudomonadota bacterium]MCP4916673.1 hypothetical protein [Pseudomonadota bacterium]